MEYFVTFVVLAAFGVFIWKKVEESRARKQERESQPRQTPRVPKDYDDRFDTR